MMRRLCITAAILALLAGAAARAEDPPLLTPAEVVVVANSAMPDSVELARHYLAARAIPETNLLLTAMPTGERIGRDDYEAQIAAPLRAFLSGPELAPIRCVVLMYGVPLSVNAPARTWDEKKTIDYLNDEMKARLPQLEAIARRAGELAAEAGLTEPLPVQTPNPKDALAVQASKAMMPVSTAFQAAGRTISAMEDGPARAQLAARFAALWAEAFGPAATPPVPGAAADPQALASRPGQQARLVALISAGVRVDNQREVIALSEQLGGAMGVTQYCTALMTRLNPRRSGMAAVDSELATLFWPPQPAEGYLSNPLNRLHHFGPLPGRTLMACRLDGPDAATVRRMIDTSLAVERDGLKGHFYIDARGKVGGGPYADYDMDLVALGERLEAEGIFPVTIDRREALFGAGDCPGTALYAGWYSYTKYVDAFTFVPGAIGYHIASGEAVSLRSENQQWCRQLLLHGAAATLGPVNEPYLTAFPLATEFFGLLLEGRRTLVECYYETTPYVSWMMTLIGDPLYRPFAARASASPVP